MPKIMQSLMYLLGFTREEICMPKSQTFWWKIANKYVTDRLPKLMADYKVLGQKPSDYKVY